MIVTLTTDFGLRDGYAAAMKGVILSRAPRATVVDISHYIAPFDVQMASYVLWQAAPYFPPGAIHVCVVDPGVGGARRGLVVEARQHLFVGPDNGVFTPFLDDAARAYELANPDLWLPRPSVTFHGRDLFAPTAVHLAQGLPSSECGPPVGDPVRLPAWDVRREGDTFTAAVVHVDHFGNLVTGLDHARLAELGDGPFRAHLPGGETLPVRRTYVEVETDEPLALIGSFGLLEIAVREGSAASFFGLDRGAPIRFSR